MNMKASLVTALQDKFGSYLRKNPGSLAENRMASIKKMQNNGLGVGEGSLNASKLASKTLDPKKMGDDYKKLQDPAVLRRQLVDNF